MEQTGGAHVRVLVRTLGDDARAASLATLVRRLGTPVEAVELADLVLVDGPADVAPLLELLAVPGVTEAVVDDAPAADAHGTVTVEVASRPGVTDRVGAELVRAAAQIGAPVASATSGRRITLHGLAPGADLDVVVRRALANPVTERWAVGAPLAPAGPPPEDAPPAVVVALGPLDDAGLAALSAERGLALDVEEMRALRQHARDRGRDLTDVELEALAQTWSEHCSHKTFRAALVDGDGAEVEPLLTTLRRATEDIAAPFVRSAFVGNAGLVELLPGTLVAVKVETHNHPSAIEPFGGAGTGVGGVVRDVLGVAARPVAVLDVLCFGPLDLDPAALPAGTLHPLLVHDGVVAGVADYGNKIGVPTVAGAVLHDPGYTANPLVFCGCIGLADEWVLALPGPQPGDRVVLLGGRTGRDGVRGATFSSMAMDATTGDVAGASVQIGDPLVEKLVMDLLATLGPDDLTAITDCGAGGLSSAVGELAEGVGCDVELDRVPRKYPGLAPWEVWLSEAQERMVLAVPPERLDDLARRAAAHGVELADLGTFTGSGQVVVRSGGHVVADLDATFLHSGRPPRTMAFTAPAPDRSRGADREVPDVAAALLALLAHPTIASKERVVRRYDHEVQGATVVRPFTGACDDGPADGVVLARPGDAAGLAVGVGVAPRYGERDPERMAWCCVDEAIRNVVAAGGDPDRAALLDNFSWGDPARPDVLGALVAAVQGCAAAARAHRAPFVSGKDSLRNEYVTADGGRRSVPPTLVVTAVASVPDAAAAVTPDLKEAGSLLVLVAGSDDAALGGSHLDAVLGAEGDGGVPAPDPAAPARHRAVHAALRGGHARACHDVSEGGLAVALAEMCIGGRLGADVSGAGLDARGLLGERTAAYVLEVAPGSVEALAALLPDAAVVLGEVTGEPVLRLPGARPLAVAELLAAWQGGSAR